MLGLIPFIAMCFSVSLWDRIDPMIFDDKYFNSRVVVDACIPYEHRNDFSPVAETSAELKAKMYAKYEKQFKEILGEDAF